MEGAAYSPTCVTKQHLCTFPAALHQDGLFRVNGNARVVETLKQRLEKGDNVDFLTESDLCTVASLLKCYLRELPGGLVDSAVQQELIRHYKGKIKKQKHQPGLPLSI